MKNRSATRGKSKKVPLSQCDLWNYQKKFFDQQGINAWDSQVPFYVTSNPYIANSYANIIIRFFQDYVNHKNYKPLEPFYILELGAGSGIFSFYIIRRLLELQLALNMKTIKFVYVMTDFTEKNIQHWRSHPALQTYINEGLLDFALYNIELDQEIILLNAGKVLAKKNGKTSLDNPLVVLANYVFDTVSHDIFRVAKGKLQQGLIKQASKINLLKNKNYITLDKLDSEFTYGNVKLPYYEDADLDAVISYYEKKLTDNCFLFPIGGLRCIKNLLEITEKNLLLIATDKGYSREFELYQQQNPSLALHASFSLMVNFQAIGQYFKQIRGDYYHQTTQQSIATSAFISGIHFDQLPETKQALAVYLNDVSHGNLYTVYRYIKNTQSSCPLEVLVSYLSIVHWDPRVFNVCLDAILSGVKSANKSVIYDLSNGMAKIAANFYYLPGADDALANIGLFFQEIGDYRSALHYYAQSMHYFEAIDSVLYNVGVCHYLLGEHKKALAAFCRVATLTPNNIMAKGWITQIKMETAAHTKA